MTTANTPFFYQCEKYNFLHLSAVVQLARDIEVCARVCESQKRQQCNGKTIIMMTPTQLIIIIIMARRLSRRRQIHLFLSMQKIQLSPSSSCSSAG